MNEGYTPDPKDIHFNVKDWGNSSEAIPPVTEPAAADLPLPPTPDNQFDFNFPEEEALADDTQKVVTVDAPAAATARPVDESNYTGRPEEDRQKHPELKAAWTSNLEDRRNAPKVGFGMEPVFIKPPAENPSDKFAFDDQPDAVISEPPVAADATKPVEVVAEPTDDSETSQDLNAAVPVAPEVVEVPAKPADTDELATTDTVLDEIASSPAAAVIDNPADEKPLPAASVTDAADRAAREKKQDKKIKVGYGAIISTTLRTALRVAIEPIYWGFKALNEFYKLGDRGKEKIAERFSKNDKS